MTGRASSNRRTRSRRGFTLVEAIAAITIIATLGSISSTLIFTAVTSYRDATTRAAIHCEISAAYDRLFRELCGVSRDTSATVVAPRISSLTVTSVSWNSNCTLTLTGNQLTLAMNGGSARVILNHVTSFSITAYNESNTALAASLSGTATQAIRRIQIQVTVSRNGVSETLRSKLFLRCTMQGAAIG